MRGEVEFSEIEEKNPFTKELRGRVIPSGFIYDPEHDNDNLPDFTDDEEWLNFIPDSKGNLRFFIGEPISSVYFGKEAENPETDVHLTFIELYVQRLSFPHIAGLFPGFLDDIRNISTVLSKIAHYQSHFSNGTLEIQRFVQTELEYLFMVSRSIYDGLQFIISNTWGMIFAVDETEDYSAELPTGSFRKMALDKGEPVSPRTLRSKYGIPDALAEFYSSEAPIFSKIRDYRDSIVHQGDSPETIFVTEDGIAVDSTAEPYNEFEAWKEDQLIENDLAPIWPFVAHIVDQTLSSLDRFLVGLLEKPLHLPHELAEDYNVYIRGPHVPNITHLNDLMEHDPWGGEFVQSVNQRFKTD